MVVRFEQLGQVKTAKGLELIEGRLGIPVQGDGQLGVLAGQVGAVVLGMVEPLLAMGKAMAPFIHRNQGVGGEVIEQGSGLAPGQPHQAPHPLRGTAFEQLIGGFGPQQILETIGHGVAEDVGDQGGVAGGGEAHHLNGVEGALAGGIEFPQFFQFVAEQLKPHRQLCAHGKHIDDVAAAAPAALLLNR